ncbi:MAG: DNA polymerase/3'-5' exonuclease PolX [Steroidobacterales bacterium]
MVLHNEQIAECFDEWADLLALSEANRFRIGAYQRAAQVIRALPDELHEKLATGFDPDTLPGIGPDLAGKIRDLAIRGTCRELEKLRKAVPAGLRDLLTVPNIGAHRARKLYDALQVHDLPSLRAALESHRVRDVPGFGPASERQLLNALARLVPQAGRRRRDAVAADVVRINDYLAALPGVSRVEIAGSYRRGCETVGDLDFVVCAQAPIDINRALAHYADTASSLAAGPTRSSVLLRSGLQVDVRVVPPESFGAALYYFTGSKSHNVHLRRMSLARGLKINEYGVFRGTQQVAGATEASVFGSVDLPFIPPELREDRGELEAAQSGRLPVLVERSQLRGDLHVHTERTDGTASFSDMAAAAQRAGLSYIAITDHSKHLGALHGLDATALARQIDEIDAHNDGHADFTILKGVEVDVLKDGTLALPDAILARLDVVVAAVHSSFDLARRSQTNRLLRMLDQRYVSILAHPTTRLLGERLPLQCDWAKIFQRASARPCYMELNAQPARLDLDDVLVREAAGNGILISIATDAHSTRDFDYLEAGILQARRGWLTPGQVLNTRPASELRKLLSRASGSRGPCAAPPVAGSSGGQR